MKLEIMLVEIVNSIVYGVLGMLTYMAYLNERWVFMVLGFISIIGIAYSVSNARSKNVK